MCGYGALETSLKTAENPMVDRGPKEAVKPPLMVSAPVSNPLKIPLGKAIG